MKSVGKASRTRTPQVAAANKRTKDLEAAGNLGNAYGILSMIITSIQKLQEIDTGVSMKTRLQAIANEAQSIRDDVVAEFEQLRE